METTSLARPKFQPLLTVLPYIKCMMVAIAVTMLFGAGLARIYFPGLDMAIGAGQMLLIAGTGWALTALLALAILGPHKFSYIHAMGDVKQTGVLVLLPVTVALLVMPALPYWIPLASVVLSSGLMLRKHIRLMRENRIPAWWTAVWFASLQLTAWAWTAYFHLV